MDARKQDGGLIARELKTDLITRQWIRNMADEKAMENGCRFDLEKAAWPIYWIQKYCRLYEGVHAGEPLMLRGAWSQKPEVCPKLWNEGGKEWQIAKLRDYMVAYAAGEPCDWQLDVVARLFGWVKHSDRWKREVRRFKKGSIFIGKKNKKALALDTPIPTPSGWSTVGSLRVGDFVFDIDGKPSAITSKTEVFNERKCYEVRFSNGESIVCDEGHLWNTWSLADVEYPEPYRGHKRASIYRSRETGDIASTLFRKDGARNHSLPMPSPIDLPDASLPVDPYVLGVWLGDGDEDAARFTCTEEDLATYRREFSVAGVDLREFKQKHGTRAGRVGIGKRWSNFRALLRMNKLFCNKHIPSEYLRAGISQRLALLQGLMDTDGCSPKNGKGVVFSTSSDAMRDGFVELLSSLGLKWRCRRIEKTSSWWIQFHCYRDEMPVFRLPRKLANMRLSTDGSMKKRRSRTVQIVDIVPVDSVPVQCITIDSPTHQFLCGRSMLPTHNSPTLAALAVYLMCADGEPGNKVFICAKNGDQARDIAGTHATEMILASESLQRECEVNKTKMKISHNPTRSMMQPLSSGDTRSQKSKEGLNGSALVDEIHVVDSDFMARIVRMGASRPEPFILSFSTAGNDVDSFGYQEWEYGTENNRTGADESYFFQTYEAPQSLSDMELSQNFEKYVRMANPALGHTIDLDEVKQDYLASKVSQDKLAEFKQYRLNIWSRTQTPWISLDAWRHGTVSTELPPKESVCWGGLDLGYVDDPSAFTIAFPNDHVAIDEAIAAKKALIELLGALDQPVRTMTWYWLPEGAISQWKHVLPYEEWVKKGLVKVQSGDVVDMNEIVADISLIVAKYDVQAIAYDPWQSATIMNNLQREVGYPEERCWEFAQNSPKIWSFPCALMERLALGRKLEHNANEILDWEIVRVAIKTDKLGGVNLVKPQRGDKKKVNGIASIIMARDAMARAERHYRSQLLIMGAGK